MSDVLVAQYERGELQVDLLYARWMASKVDDLDFVHGLLTSPGQRLLDVGCGFGRGALSFGRLGWEVTAIDRNRDLISIGQTLFPDEASRIKWVVCDIGEYEATEVHAYDAILCLYNTINEVLTDLSKLFRLFGAAIKKNGILVIRALSDAPYERRGLIEWNSTFDFGTRQVHVFTTSNLIDRLSSLLAFYELYDCNGLMEKRLAQTIRRRIWSATEIESCARSEGFERIGPLDTNWYIFAKDAAFSS